MFRKFRGCLLSFIFAIGVLHARADENIMIPGGGEYIKFVGGTHDCSGTYSSCMTNAEVYAEGLSAGDTCGSYAEYSNANFYDKLEWTSVGGFDSAYVGGPGMYFCKSIGVCKVYLVFGARVCLCFAPTQTRL